MMWEGFRYGFRDGCGIENGWIWLIVIMIIIFVAFIVSLIIYLIVRNANKHNIDNDKSLSILKERLAKGEITTEEYENLKNALDKK